MGKTRTRTALKIREIRKARGFSQVKLAELVGVSYQQVQKYERGATDISVARLQQIARALAAPVSAFFDTEADIILEQPVLYGGLTKGESKCLDSWRQIKDEKARKALLELMKYVRTK